MPKEFTSVERFATNLKSTLGTCRRRQFLFKGSLLAALAAVLPAGRWGSRILPGLAPLSALSLATFTGLLGTVFKIHPREGSLVELKLQKAQRLSFCKPPRHGASPAWEGFSLVFSGPPGQALAQDTYCFEHGQVGRFDMFIVPIGQPSDGVPRYQAVFSRPCREDRQAG